MKPTHSYLFIFIALFFVSCNQKSNKQQNFDYGTIENGKYVNTFFDLEMQVPADWNVLSQAQNANLMNNSDQVIAEDNKALQQAVETSKITTVILLTASQYGLQVADSIFNPNIMLLAENLEGSQNVNVSSDYLLITRKALQQDPAPKEFAFNSFQVKDINGTEFTQMRVINKAPDTPEFTQDYYVSLQQGFALTYILTYSNEIQHTALQQILSSVKISNE